MTLFLTVSKNLDRDHNLLRWVHFVICVVYTVCLKLIYGFNHAVLVPKVQFRDAVYVGNENSGKISAIVYRSGDISYKSTVRCYSRQGTAQVMMDFSERPNTDASIITFLPGRAVEPVCFPLYGLCFFTRRWIINTFALYIFQERLKSLVY